jgi:hypothetical protein
MIDILTILASTEAAEPQGIAALGLNFLDYYCARRYVLGLLLDY